MEGKHVYGIPNQLNFQSKPLDEEQKARIPHGGTDDQATSAELFHPNWENQTHTEYFNFNFGLLPLEFDSRKQWPQCPSIGAVYDQVNCF